jgi:hypothetical protein
MVFVSASATHSSLAARGIVRNIHGSINYFGLGFGALPLRPINVSWRIASDLDGMGRSFARHSSMACKYSSEHRNWIWLGLGSEVGLTIIVVIRNAIGYG